MPLNYRILGALEIDRTGEPLAVPGAKPRALLAILLLNANRDVSGDRLVEELWTTPPDTARAALQVHVAKLRRILEPGLAHDDPAHPLQTRGAGYVLHAEPERIDARRFERLVGEARAAAGGDPATVRALLGEALALWRGPALADFAYEPFAQAEIARLDELRLDAIQDRLDADLALADHEGVAGELEELVRAHPLRERLCGQLMLALYRCGRQADALAAYQTLRSQLDRELGIAPGGPLRQLQAAILRQDRALDAQRASDERVAVRESRTVVTVLVSGRAAVPSIDPEAAQELDRRHRDAATAAIGSHGGLVDSVLAGTVVGVFGVPRVHEDDALRAARAAIDVAAHPTDSARAGIATGEIVTGRNGLTGAPITAAVALESAAAVGHTLVDAATLDLLGDTARVEHAGPADGVWRLLELVPPPPPLAELPTGPIVGRADELAQLQQALDRTARGPSVHLFTILGSAGIGKSRLAEEFAALVAPRATVAAGRCVAYGETTTFAPLREIAAQLTASEPAERGAGVQEAFWAFRRLFEGAAREQPLVLVLEDLHWATPTLLDFVDYLADRSTGAPVLVLCLARPELLELRPGWGGGKRNATTLSLERLSDRETAELIELRGSRLSGAARTRVQEMAEGNPLFAEQLLAMLLDGRQAAGETATPASIQAVLAARLDSLGPGERAVIESAAVVGRTFDEDVVAALLPADARPTVARLVNVLVRKDLAVPIGPSPGGGRKLRFRHSLIRQAAYRSIPKRRRAERHELAAAALHGMGADTGAREGYHLEQAYLCRAELGPATDADRTLARRAAALLADAGRDAFRRGDMPAAAGLLRRVLALLPADDPMALTLLPDLGFALFETGELHEANTLLRRAIDRGQALGDRRLEWNATVVLAHATLFTDPARMDPDRLAGDAQAAIDALEELGDEDGLARAWALFFEAEWARGRMTAAAAAAERGARYAARTGSRREATWALGSWAHALVTGTVPVPEAIAQIERVLGQSAGNIVVEANLTGFRAMLEAMAGRFDEARRDAALSCERLHDLGLTWWAGVQELLAGYVELLAGDPVAAERHLRAASGSFEAIGDRWFLSAVAVDLPRAMYEQGRLAEARTLVQAIDRDAVPADREWQIKRWGVRARLLAHDGRAGEAEEYARRGVAAAEGTELIWSHAEALVDLADVLRRTGQPNAADDAAAGALALYKRKGIVRSLPLA